MSSALGDYFNKLRTNKYSIPLGIAIAALLSMLLMIYTWYICFSYMAIALVMYGIPNYFGLKNKKKLAVVGLVLLMFLGLGWALMMHNSIMNFEKESLSSDNYLSDGTVDPVRASAGDLYTFSVVLDSSAPNHNVTLDITNSWTDTDKLTYQMESVDNITFTKTVQLNETGIFEYKYSVWTGSDIESASKGYGPITASSDRVLTSALSSGMLLSFLQIGVLFYMLIFLTWWMDRSKDKVQAQLELAKKKRGTKTGEDGKTEEKFVCSECGADVPIDADKCPQCGEKFDDGKEMKCPKCGAAIFETDKKCWNCGRELEDQGKK
jgi:DNA-directed RNA polymerase subunit RPC12/RpoP